MDIIDLSTIPDIPVAIAGIWGAIAQAAGSVLGGSSSDEDEGGIGPALVSAGGSLLGGIMGRNAQEDATEAQVQAQREALDFQREKFNQIMEMNRPIHESNLRARRAQEDLLGLGGMGGAQATPSGGSATNLPNRQTGTMPRERAPNQFEVPGSGVRTGIPGMTAPEPGAMGSLGVNRFRGNRDRFAEGRINDLANSPENRQQFLLNQVRAGNVDPNNPHVRNILSKLGN